MKLSTAAAPHIRHNENTRVIMGDAILTMLIIYGMAVYYYGMRAAFLMLVSVFSALITDVVCILVAGKRPNSRDFSAIVTGMILPLILPVTIDYWIVAVAAIFGIMVAKHPFGGVGHNVFNPAAAGFAFVAISFPEKIFTYPLPLERVAAFGELSYQTGISPAYTLELGGIPKYDLISMLLGSYPGPMGATNIVVILTCLLYLVSRNTIRWITPLSFFATTAAFSFLFPRIGGFDSAIDVRMQSVAYEMMSGILLFGGVFLLGDPVTAPKRGWAKAAWAIMAGVAVMMFRRFGNFEEELPFAILLMNATVWVFDIAAERVARRLRRKKFEDIDGNTVQTPAPSA